MFESAQVAKLEPECSSPQPVTRSPVVAKPMLIAEGRAADFDLRCGYRSQLSKID